MPRLTAFNTTRRQSQALAEQSARRHGGQVLWVLIHLGRNITFCEDHPGQPGSGGMTLAWRTEYAAKSFARRWSLGEGWKPQKYDSHTLDVTAEKMAGEGYRVSWRWAGAHVAPSIVADHVDPLTGQVIRVPWGDAGMWFVEDELGAWLREGIDGE